MEVVNFRSYWKKYFPDCPPVSYLFKHDLANRWFRFHSLPESKRYADDNAEITELLFRQNTVLLDVIGPGECIVVLGNYSSSPSCYELCPSLLPIKFQNFLNLSKQDFDPNELETGEEPLYLNLYYGIHELNFGSLDGILLCAAEEKIVNFFVVNFERQRIFAPYDGGVDVILNNTKERDEYRAKYADWLSRHPAGL